MDIVKLTEKQIAQLKIGCPTLAHVNLGEIINIIIDSVNAKEKCSYDLDPVVVKQLNNMCVFNGIELGNLISVIISATASYSEDIDNLELKQIAALNQTCGTLKGVNLGDVLSKLINEINSYEPIKPVTKVIIDELANIIVGETKEMTITWEPEDASNKEYTIQIDNEYVEANKIDENKFNIVGVEAGESVVTITPDDGGEGLSVNCNVTVVAE